MAKQKLSSKKTMNMSNGMFVAMGIGIIIGFLVAMMYNYMTNSTENLATTPTKISFNRWATQVPLKKPLPAFPSNWKSQRDICRKSGGNWYDYNERIQTRLLQRHFSGSGGQCWDLNNKGQTTNLCCDFKV